MSKERQARRAAREAEVAEQAAARAQAAAAAARRRRLLQPVTSATSRLRPRSKPGVLAAKRRRFGGLLALAFVVIQILTWAFTPDWGVRAFVLVVSIFAVPVAAVLLLPSRRS